MFKCAFDQRGHVIDRRRFLSQDLQKQLPCRDLDLLHRMHEESVLYGLAEAVHLGCHCRAQLHNVQHAL